MEEEQLAIERLSKLVSALPGYPNEDDPIERAFEAGEWLICFEGVLGFERENPGYLKSYQDDLEWLETYFQE